MQRTSFLPRPSLYPKAIKTSYDDTFSSNGNIFGNCSYNWAPIKKVILEELFHAVQKLETFNILGVQSQIVSEVGDAVAAIAKMDIRFEWIDKVLDEIKPKKDHHTLLPKAQMLCSKRRKELNIA